MGAATGAATVAAGTGGTEFGGSAVPAAEQSAAPVSPVEDPAARAARCQVIYNLDQRFCAEQVDVFGRASGDICRASAQARVAACNDGTAMPGLENHRPRGR